MKWKKMRFNDLFAGKNEYINKKNMNTNVLYYIMPKWRLFEIDKGCENDVVFSWTAPTMAENRKIRKKIQLTSYKYIKIKIVSKF